ncbi:hypothetical protein Barb4_03046 [Bacteroidales bacterium Barb4]|nr:hypothetical protein Barb4_03046 [Bacteroidales bacterium Barb4]
MWLCLVHAQIREGVAYSVFIVAKIKKDTGFQPDVKRNGTPDSGMQGLRIYIQTPNRV